ncbi:DoxX family protein [Mycolicibacterium sp. XJ870]
MPLLLRSAGNLRLRSTIYSLTTLIIVTESAVGGVWDIVRIDYVRDVVEQQLGYPGHLLMIIGVCKIAGAIILLIPKVPRLKEWAYAGVFFIYSGAIISHLAVGDVEGAIGPGGLTVITMTSWALRPDARREVTASLSTISSWIIGTTRSKAVVVGYWATTGVIAVVLLAGGLADVLRRPETADGMQQLGYPLYFVSLLGTWKLLGAIAILAPRFPRLKEWAYAGAFYDFAGACTSHLISGSPVNHAVVPGIFAACTIASWAMRPHDRALRPLAPIGRTHQPESIGH